MITQEKAEEALMYLANTDEEYARAKARLKRLEKLEKQVRGAAFLQAEGTQGKREAEAFTSDEWKMFVADFEDATLNCERLGNKRDTAATVIEFYRTLAANQRRG